MAIAHTARAEKASCSPEERRRPATGFRSSFKGRNFRGIRARLESPLWDRNTDKTRIRPGKLRPLSLSCGFFEAATERLRRMCPPGGSGLVLPASLSAFTVAVVDGKILKKVAKRLLPARGKAGRVYGGKLG